MTRRERLENKLEKRRLWAEARKREADRRFDTAHKIVEHIPFGQPILVGHHSEKRHRAALNRHDNNMRAGVNASDMAEHHEQKATGLEAQLEHSIFSDDDNAIEALEEKIAGLEAERDEAKRLNKWWKKHGTMAGCPGLSEETAQRFDVEIPKSYSWQRQPVPSYRLTNLGATIRQAKKRIEDVKARHERTTKAEQATGGLVIEGDDYVRITFAEKPERSILDALKAADFRWGAGSWCGRRDKIPAEVQALTATTPPESEPQ